jgi:hypothetical protein
MNLEVLILHSQGFMVFINDIVYILFDSKYMLYCLYSGSLERIGLME